MPKKQYDAVWINALLATCEEGYGLITDAAIAVKDDKIAWIGKTQNFEVDSAKNLHDVKGCCITPGFIDCHTHLVYAGNRAHEFEMRLQGATYAEIAKQGGGIQATVSATRSASKEELLLQSIKRAVSLLASGASTIEIKSGYGLNWQTEFKILRVAKQLEEILPITVKRTFLGAHALPAEYRDKPDDYIDLICNEMIPVVAAEKLADAVDVFCENIAFNLAQTERVFKAAKEYGLAIKCHAEQLSDSGSAALAAKYHALSVDHLEYVSSASVKAIAKSGTVAVLLPGAFYFLRETKVPPVKLLRDANIPIAIATDCNPGTSPITSLLLILNMACTLFGLTPEEAIQGVTRNAARALGMLSTHGTLSVGKIADFAIWEVSHPIDLVYYLGTNPLQRMVKAGQYVV